MLTDSKTKSAGHRQTTTPASIQKKSGTSTPTIQTKKQCPAKPINDGKVVGYIKAAIKYVNLKGMSYNPGKIASLASGHLKGQRDAKANHCNWNLAAAEHYMLTRAFSSHGNWLLPGSPKSPPGGVMAIVGGYNMIKGSVGMIKEGTGPHSPITAKALAWAQQGTIDGTYFPRKYIDKTCQLYYFEGKIGKKTFSKSDNIIVTESKKLLAPSKASLNMGVPRIKVQPVTHSGYKAFGKQPLRWVKTSKLSCYH